LAWVVVPSVSIKAVECLHLVVAEVEIEDLDVLMDALNSRALRDNLSATLQSPAVKNLCACLLMSCSNIFNALLVPEKLLFAGHVLSDPGRASQTAVSSDLDAVFGTEAEHILLSEVRVQFVLENSRLDLGELENLVDEH